MSNEAMAAADHEWEMLIENQIDAYLEACSLPDEGEEEGPVVLCTRRVRRGAR